VLAMLHTLLRRDTGRNDRLPVAARFPSGPAPGSQIRNPGGLGFAASPQFYTSQVRREDLARWQLRAGWIIRAVLEQRTDLFAKEARDASGGIVARCHAMEASLFMIGYDLRSLMESDGPGHHLPDVPDEGGNWVPAGHPFGLVIASYREFQETRPPDHGMAPFKAWLKSSPLPRHAAFVKNFTYYRYPLGEREFNLADRTLDEIRSIEAGGEAGLLVANDGEPHFVAGDEQEQVCLVCAGLTGHCYERDTNGYARAERLVGLGFAGTQKAADTLLAVGRNVGHHFGLLDARHRPTKFFRWFYQDGFDDFRIRPGVQA
jgi:hypothetical protein